MTTVALYVASAAGWDSNRRAPLDRLTKLVPSATVLVSEEREHSSIWAVRMYKKALADGADVSFFLNDDIAVPDEFEKVAQAIVDAVPDQPMSLATVCPEAREATGPWLRSYLQSGPLYAFPRGHLAGLIEYYSQLPPSCLAKMNEDEIGAYFAWTRQTPLYQSIPSLALHDVKVPSTLGYDHHPRRVAERMWTKEARREGGPQLTDRAHWIIGEEPPFAPHPWLPEGMMEKFRRSLQGGQDVMLCALCETRTSDIVANAVTGARICQQCAGIVFKNVAMGINFNER
jgi:hypothetical protein